MNEIVNVGVAEQIGRYSDAVMVPAGAKTLYTSGTPGLMPDGTLPTDLETQAEWAWRNIIAMLEKAGMGVGDLVKVTHYLTDESYIKPYVEVRSRFLGDARPASMLMVVPALVKPPILVEVEAWAAR